MWLLVSNQAGSVDPPLTEGFLLAHSEISADLIAAYRATDYRLGQGADAFTLRIDTYAGALSRLYALSRCTCGVFITAYNPFGKDQSLEANESAHTRLREELKVLAPGRVIEGAGADPTGDRPEEKSFFALGLDLNAARDLGSSYKQDAIVWVGEDAVPKLILLR